MRRSVMVFWGVVQACLALAATAAPAQIPVLLRFCDDTGTLIPVRAGAFISGIPKPPVNPAAYLYQQRGSQSYFYCDGAATLNIPPGPLTIRAGRGFEYQARDTTLVVKHPMTITMTLPRLVDMKSHGVYSGDTHVHISHPPIIYTLDALDLLLVAGAEDLNLVNSMEEEPYFTGELDPVSQPDRLIYFSKEQRNAHFSHLTVLGLKQWIVDQGCVEEGIACARTLDEWIYAEVHAQPGETAVIATHPFSTLDMHDLSGWPGVGMWRAMAIDLPAGAVDAMDLLDYSNAAPSVSVAPYMKALNAGFRLPPSAGSDCTLGSGDSGPAGGCRTYVMLDGAFTMDAWIAGLKAGRSFVSNYPLFTHFDLEGAVAGDVVETDASILHGSVSVTSGVPIQQIEIFGDLGLLAVIHAPGGWAKTLSGSFSVSRAGLTWVVARATGKNTSWHATISPGGLFAQTGPVYLVAPPSAGPGQGNLRVPLATRTAAADYFIGMLGDAVSLFDEDGYFPDGSRDAFDTAVERAYQYYTELATPVTDAGKSPRLSAWVLGPAGPNPFDDVVRVSYTVPPAGGAHAVEVYDALGRRIRRLYSGSRGAGDYELRWDGRDDAGARMASGVYFLRVKPEDGVAVSRKLVLVH
jgi:hypothetical protein